MERRFTLQYRVDNGWYVGRLVEVPGVMSQGETLEELEENVRDAYDMMVKETTPAPRPNAQTKELALVA